LQTQCRDHLLDEDNVTVSTIKTTESDRQAARKYIQSLSNSSRIDARYGPLTKLAASDEDDYYDESLLSGGSSLLSLPTRVTTTSSSIITPRLHNHQHHLLQDHHHLANHNK